MTHSSDRARALWCSCLVSAYRTSLACILVGCATFYGPSHLKRLIPIPAFSYVTVILIVTDATLGDTLRGCWLALYATIQSVAPALLSLWLIGPARLSCATTALAVAIAAFMVALPEWTHLVSKRIALGQIVIIYVFAYINGTKVEPVVHPIHIASSTAFGVLACVLALLLPFPRLACLEMKDNLKLFSENVTTRLKLLVQAFCSDDNISSLSSISQAKLLAPQGTKLLQNIQRYQESMQWEKPPIRCSPYNRRSFDMLKDANATLNGMQMALASTDSFPVTVLNEGIKGSLVKLEDHIISILKQPCNSLTTVPETNIENPIISLQTLQSIPTTLIQLPSFFFLFCLTLLHNKSLARHSYTTLDTSCQQTAQPNKFSLRLTKDRLIPAIKCSISLGLAVFFGLLYSKKNGHWSGLPVAISFAASREATFRVANVKAQGTVIGTVYGVLGCFLFDKFVPVKFLSLLPWFIFTSFLRRSKMYSQAGGVSAVIGAVLILVRKDFGLPSEFAIARIVETFIGLSCSIMVELIFLPTRASTLAKHQLSKTLAALHECISSFSIQTSKERLIEKQMKLKSHVNVLRKLSEEANMEPNFWFFPFPTTCYDKIIASLSKMTDVLLFEAHAVGNLEQHTHKELVDDIEHFNNKLTSSLKCYERVTSIRSIAELDKEMGVKNVPCDLEKGKLPEEIASSVHGLNEEEMEMVVRSYMEHVKEVVEKKNSVEGNKELNGKLVLSLSSLGFCMRSLMKEMIEIEKGIKEVVQLENPSSPVNLYEISYKVQALNKSIQT